MTVRTIILAIVASTFLGMAAQARSRRVHVATGVTIHVLDEGRADSSKPTLVFIPGWTLPADIWERQIDRFRRERRVIAIDPRSQGESSIVPEGNTPEHRAEDLHSVLERLGATPVVLVGWSQGVQDVAAYVNEFGTEGIAGIVLVDSTVSTGADSVQSAPAAAERTLQFLRIYNGNPRAYLRGMLSAIVTRPMSDRERNRLVGQMIRTPTAIGSSMLVADLLGNDRSSAVTKIDRPTLVVASAASPELAEQRAMAGRIPGADFETVHGAGHALFFDQPAIFNQMLVRFLDERVGQGRSVMTPRPSNAHGQ